jgi:hypothetical protein
MSLIEKTGQKKIGFYCWKFFILDYRCAYEVSRNLIQNQMMNEFQFYTKKNSIKFFL